MQAVACHHEKVTCSRVLQPPPVIPVKAGIHLSWLAVSFSGGGDGGRSQVGKPRFFLVPLSETRI